MEAHEDISAYSLVSLLILWLVCFLTVVGWCKTPESVVREVFGAQQRLQNAEKTVQQCEDCFTPGFLGILERALKRREYPYVDFNIFGNSQTDTGHFEVGEATYPERHAVVPVKVWTGLRSTQTITDRNARATWQSICSARVHLTNVGSGWQIFDLEWVKAKDRPAISVRKYLTPIAEGGH